MFTARGRTPSKKRANPAMTRTRLQDTQPDAGKTRETPHERKNGKKEVPQRNGSEDHVAASDCREGSPSKVCKITESGEDGTTHENGKDVVFSDVDKYEGGEVMTAKVSHYYSQGDSDHKWHLNENDCSVTEERPKAELQQKHATIEEHWTVKKEKCGASFLTDEHKITNLRRRPIHSKTPEGDAFFHPSKSSAKFLPPSRWMPETKSDSALLSRASTGNKHNKSDCTKEAPNSIHYLQKSDPCRQPRAETKKTDGLKWLIWVLVVVTVAILSTLLWKSNITNRVMEKDFSTLLEGVKSNYPSQQEQLWKKIMIHLQQNIRATKPTEPVTMILTAGWKAEKTLQCLAGDLATAFSSVFNASVLHIDGARWAAQDSDEVKLAMDQELMGAFEKNKMAAIIHRFQELPPGSALIFYKYCDHENAAYKAVLFVFTVLLPMEGLDPMLRPVAVEEMVHDHIQTRFLSLALPGTFNQMDMDKFGGLWSRISHLVLPVVLEEQMEKNGCHS